jgi:hypothetical protein
MVTIVVGFGDIFAFDHPFRFGIIMRTKKNVLLPFKEEHAHAGSPQ